MNNYMFFMIVFCAVAGMALFSSMTAGLKKTFEIDPAASRYTSEEPQSAQSRKTADVEEKNRRMMEQLQAKMDRIKR